MKSALFYGCSLWGGTKLDRRVSIGVDYTKELGTLYR